jgi:hypothetical protein
LIHPGRGTIKHDIIPNLPKSPSPFNHTC